jgi:predicted DNA-binding protein (MmcQ/YjbR family)
VAGAEGPAGTAPEAVLRAVALGYPEAVEEHPWGESAFKVRTKVSVFMGVPADGCLSLSVKLPESASVALLEPWASPTGYGLGRSGWVSFAFGPGDDVPVERIEDWIDESYRAIAPKRLVATLAPLPDPG